MEQHADYQVEQHLAGQRTQWPHLDAEVERDRIRRAVISGNAWLYPQPDSAAAGRMPVQIDLFSGAR